MNLEILIFKNKKLYYIFQMSSKYLLILIIYYKTSISVVA